MSLFSSVTACRAKKSVSGGHDTFYIGGHYQLKVKDSITQTTQHIFAGSLRIAQIQDGIISYFHKDHLGSSTAMSNGSGVKIESQEYFPYGSQRSTSAVGISNYKFTDQELDPESGLYNYNARLYDPIIGKFITADSIVPDFSDPQSLNRYAYCYNNPLLYTDPSGLFYQDPYQLS